MKSIRQSRRARRADRHSDAQGGTHHERWLVSYADLLTLLFALFVILYAAADHDRARAIAQAVATELGDTTRSAPAVPGGGRGVLPGTDRLVSARQALDRAFASNEALRSRAHIRTTERGIVVSLAEAGFFAPGEAVLREDAVALVDSLADALQGSDAPLRVEGHTDSLPISNARYPSNWELSAGRASAVLARFAARGIPSSRLSVAGYAGERPIADNATAEGRALNRRVDLVILRSSD